MDSKHGELKNLLFQAIDSVLVNKEEFLQNPDKDFSRKRKISLRDTMMFPIVAAGDSTFMEMLDYFPKENLPQQSSLTYRRNQLKSSAFKTVFKSFTNNLVKRHPGSTMNFIAVDGTTLNTPYNPKDPSTYINCIKDRKGINQLHLNTLYDIERDLFVDTIVQGIHSMNETEAFCQMMKSYTSDSKALFIGDRGYCSYNTIACACFNEHYFLFRMDSTMAEHIFSDMTPFHSGNEADIEDIIHIGRRDTKENSNLKNYHYIPKSRTYDFLAPGSNDTHEFKVRVLRIHISDHTDEFIVTNLPADKFSSTEIKAIYNRRWNIETSYRYLKYAQGLVYMHSIKYDFILQEIFAKLTAYNFSSAIMRIESKKMNSKPRNRATKYEYRIDRTFLIKACRLFLQGQIDDLDQLLHKRKVPVRPDRTFARNLARQRSHSLLYRG